MPWIEEARSVFDEVVIFVDEKRATTGTLKRAKKAASRVLLNKADTWYGPNWALMAPECDWVFMLDYDEQLSPEWHTPGWRQILEKDQFTHFWFSRRWVVPGQRYITSDPWWPDLQLRLLRNNLRGTVFPKKIHDPIHVPGCGAYLPGLAIHHHVLWLTSRETRLEKVRYYEELRPGEGLGHLYLYEDYHPLEAPLPRPQKLPVNNEALSMDRLLPEDILKVSYRVTGVPRTVRASALFWLDVEVANGGDRILYPYPPFPVRLAYHWIAKSTRRMVVFEGHRSGLFPCLPAYESLLCRMAVVAPSQPGEYILQVTLVQDGVSWFEEMDSDAMREFFVSVFAEDRIPEKVGRKLRRTGPRRV